MSHCPGSPAHKICELGDLKEAEEEAESKEKDRPLKSVRGPYVKDVRKTFGILAPYPLSTFGFDLQY